MVFVKKWPFSMVCFFPQNKPEKMFSDILDRKGCFLDKKNEILKKVYILKGNFPNGISPWILSKNSHFPFMGQKNFFLDIMNRKEFFLEKKNEVFKQ